MFVIFSVIVLIFGFVVFFGAPYLPTQRKQAQTALDLLNLKAGQTLYELGCGDGRVMRQAARRGIRVVGYELNPILFFVAWLVTLRYRKLVKVKLGNFWQADLSDVDGVFVFLLDKYMPKLDRKLSQLERPVKLVSFAFRIPDKKPAKEQDGVFLYRYH